jgi:hypothetical protein
MAPKVRDGCVVTGADSVAKVAAVLTMGGHAVGLPRYLADSPGTRSILPGTGTDIGRSGSFSQRESSRRKKADSSNWCIPGLELCGSSALNCVDKYILLGPSV